MIAAEHISEIRALLQPDTLSADVDALSADIAAKRSELTSKQSELDRLLDLEREDHVKRVLGEDAAPERPKRLTRISNLNDDITGLSGAIPILEGRLKELQSQRSKVAADRPGKILPILRQSRQQVADEIREKLEALMPLAAQLHAFQVIQDRIVGALGRHATAEDFDAQKLVEAAFCKMPSRLKPGGASTIALQAQSEQFAADMLQKIFPKNGANL